MSSSPELPSLYVKDRFDQVQARQLGQRAAVRDSPPAQTGLANVVRCPRLVPAQPVVRRQPKETRVVETHFRLCGRFVSLLYRLLENEPDVVALLDVERHPFSGARPPKLVRARLYHYHFTNSSEGAVAGRRFCVLLTLWIICFTRHYTRTKATGGNGSRKGNTFRRLERHQTRLMSLLWNNSKSISKR